MLPVRAALIAVLVTGLMVAPARAQEPSPEPEQRIAQGVSAAGVELSNLTIAEATARLEEALTAPLAVPIVVAVAGHRWTLKPERAKFAFDAERTAKRAYYAGLNHTPTAPEGGGAPPGLTVPLAVELRRAPIRDFAERIDRRVRIRPRDAYVRITLRRILRRPAKEGRDLRDKQLRATIEAALADPRLPRLLKPGRRHTKAKVLRHHLRRRYNTVITVDKRNFRLRLFKKLRLKKSYGVAIGQPAYPTPSGLFSITSKQVNPTWTAPNSPWAGEMAGQSVSGGAWNNPLKARWMGIVNGVGIHGTGQEYSIGTAASHGCLRMRVADVIDLYPRVPIGTRVLIR